VASAVLRWSDDETVSAETRHQAGVRASGWQRSPGRESSRFLAGCLRPCDLGVVQSGRAIAQNRPAADEFNDSHFHLTNYVQEGIDVSQFLKIMGNRVARSILFGIPLQQQWSYANSGDFAPTYYLQTDAPLYHYSFTDAHIASVYRSLSREDQLRFDPMITGFNPADMYGVDHIRRVLQIFPGVFTGIGEFTIHKEFVSGKISGETASLTNPALDRILDFAGEVGLVVLIHNDVDVPFAKEDAEPVYMTQRCRGRHHRGLPWQIRDCRGRAPPRRRRQQREGSAGHCRHLERARRQSAGTEGSLRARRPPTGSRKFASAWRLSRGHDCRNSP